MKVLLDTCIWGGVAKSLSAAGHDAVWSGNWEADPGDEEILATAFRERRVLVTLDKDFGTLAFLHGKPHAGILRLVNLTTRQQPAICAEVLERYGQALEQGAVITAESDRVRIRRSGSE